MSTNPSVARRMSNVKQGVMGRKPFVYEFEVIPNHAVDLPDCTGKVAFVLERGQKVQHTEPEKVNKKTHAVFWKQFVKQTATVYKSSSGEPSPKEYSFKVQELAYNAAGKEERRTLAKTKINLSQFCVEEMEPKPHELTLPLKPSGTLKVSVRARWLADADPDRVSETTMGVSAADWDDEGEQDLSGFDDGGSAGRARSARTDTKRLGRRSVRRDGIPEGHEASRDAELHQIIDEVTNTLVEEGEERPRMLCCCLPRPPPRGRPNRMVSPEEYEQSRRFMRE